MKKWILVALLPIVGCATVRESYAPDGRKAYSLNCSGTARGWDKCQSAAGELCREAGYEVLDRTSESMLVAGGSVNSTGGSGMATKSNERSMLIACKTKS